MQELARTAHVQIGPISDDVNQVTRSDRSLAPADRRAEPVVISICHAFMHPISRTSRYIPTATASWREDEGGRPGRCGNTIRGITLAAVGGLVPLSRLPPARAIEQPTPKTSRASRSVPTRTSPISTRTARPFTADAAGCRSTPCRRPSFAIRFASSADSARSRRRSARRPGDLPPASSTKVHVRSPPPTPANASASSICRPEDPACETRREGSAIDARASRASRASPTSGPPPLSAARPGVGGRGIRGGRVWGDRQGKSVDPLSSIRSRPSCSRCGPARRPRLAVQGEARSADPDVVRQRDPVMVVGSRDAVLGSATAIHPVCPEQRPSRQSTAP